MRLLQLVNGFIKAITDGPGSGIDADTVDGLHAADITGTGLETIDEGNGDGLVIIGRTAANYGNVGYNAIDLSRSLVASSTFGATGTRSNAGGYLVTASGQSSFANGVYTKAQNYASCALGKYNVGTDSGTILEIGIGTSTAAKKNGLEVYTDGTLTAPESTITLINSRGVKTIITKEYYSAGTVASANKLATARTIDITGDITATAVAFNGTANIAISASVNNDSHTHNTQHAPVGGSYSTNWACNTLYADATLDTYGAAYAKNNSFAGRSVNWGYASVVQLGHYAYYLSTSYRTYIRVNNVQNTVKLFSAEVAGNTKIKLQADGNCYADGSWSGGGADYAEYFEWADSNPEGEDRYGYSVVLENRKVRLATEEDSSATIIGVVSAKPAIVGDAEELGWSGKFIKNKFGAREKAPITTYTFDETITSNDGSGRTKIVKSTYRHDDIPEGVIIPEDAEEKIEIENVKISPEYDPDQEYIPRSERKEWVAIGLIGKLRILKGMPVGDRWIKLKDIDQEVEEWLVR